MSNHNNHSNHHKLYLLLIFLFCSTVSSIIIEDQAETIWFFFLNLLEQFCSSYSFCAFFNSPNVQLLGWLTKKLPDEKKLPAEFKDCVAPLFSCLEDRNGGVRDAAKTAAPHFMAHLGYDTMSKATAKLDVSIQLVWLQVSITITFVKLLELKRNLKSLP